MEKIDILILFVEGVDDMLFAEKIVHNYLQHKHNKPIVVKPIPYANKKPHTGNKIIKANSKYKYLFLSDLDSHKFKCITSRKEKRCEEYKELSYSDDIIIVKEEIESWYLAGIDTASSNMFKNLQIPDNTEDITKEMFDEMTNDFSKKDCLVEIAKNYDFELAKSRNSSFKYFLDKLDKIF